MSERSTADLAEALEYWAAHYASDNNARLLREAAARLRALEATVEAAWTDGWLKRGHLSNAPLGTRIAEKPRLLQQFLAALSAPPVVPADDRWKRCPSTHCERRQECSSPHECSVKAVVSMPSEPCLHKFEGYGLIPMVCELVAGHQGNHREGSIQWAADTRKAPCPINRK